VPAPDPAENDRTAYQPDDNTRLALAELGCEGSDELTVGGVAAGDLAKEFGTPLYAFSADALRRRVRHIQSLLGPRFGLLWSIKANPSVAVTECLRLAGAGAEIASIGELEVALAAGHAAEDLRFAGPGKSDQELEHALGRGLGTFHVESLDELNSLAALTERGERAAAVALRVNLPEALRGTRMRMGGHSSRFGIDAEQIPAAIAAITGAPNLTLRGLHVYGGTQCFDAEAFIAHAHALATHAASWERELDVRFAELDLGGGFGVATFAGDPVFDLERCAAGLRELLAEYDRPDRRWFLELGRYLAAPAGAFLTRVLRTKTSGGQRHAVLDGGMHQAAAAAGLGTIVRRPPLIVAAQRLGPAAAQTVTLGGPLCTPADQFAEQQPLPALERGDLVAILNAGAYGLTYSPSGFLSHPAAAEVLVDGGEARVVRKRGTSKDSLRDQQR